jgi:hypothetical protein
MDGGSDVSAVTALIYPFFCCGEEGLGGKGGLEGREDGAESGDKAMQGCENEWGARYRMTGIQDVALKAKQRKGAEASSGSKAQPPAAPLSMYGGPESNVPPPSLPPSLPPPQAAPGASAAVGHTIENSIPLSIFPIAADKFAICVCGLPGVGKTHIARRLGR